MSDFILPGEIEAMAHQVSADISLAWDKLYTLCRVKGYAVSLAEVSVHAFVQSGMPELVAIQKVYREIART